MQYMVDNLLVITFYRPQNHYELGIASSLTPGFLKFEFFKSDLYNQ